jgi:hypothetical protein
VLKRVLSRFNQLRRFHQHPVVLAQALMRLLAGSQPKHNCEAAQRLPGSEGSSSADGRAADQLTESKSSVPRDGRDQSTASPTTESAFPGRGDCTVPHFCKAHSKSERAEASGDRKDQRSVRSLPPHGRPNVGVNSFNHLNNVILVS